MVFFFFLLFFSSFFFLSIHPSQSNPIVTHTGVVSQANGSAYMELNGTKVMCAVYGPRESQRTPQSFSDIAVLTCNVKRAPFSSPLSQSRIGFSPQQEEIDQELSLNVFTAIESSILLEKYAKSSIDVYVTILAVSENIQHMYIDWRNGLEIIFDDSFIDLFGIIIIIYVD